jgi:hypothetical protein
MNEYQPQILWEITRAVVSIAAWWVLFTASTDPRLFGGELPFLSPCRRLTLSGYLYQ